MCQDFMKKYSGYTMRNLIFYTCHRQLIEIELSSKFFNKSSYLKSNFDVVLHCNNPEYELKQLKEYNRQIKCTSSSIGRAYRCQR